MGGKWYICSERLPAAGRIVPVVDASYDASYDAPLVAFWSEHSSRWVDPFGDYISDEDQPYAWFDLPQPPQK